MSVETVLDVLIFRLELVEKSILALQSPKHLVVGENHIKTIEAGKHIDLICTDKNIVITCTLGPELKALKNQFDELKLRKGGTL